MELRKNIVSILYDSKGNELEVTADYIGVNAFAKKIFKMYKDCLDGFGDNADVQEYLNNIFDDESLIEKANDFAFETNEWMKVYLHQKSHHIDGNLNDIDINYPHYRTGVFWAHEYGSREEYEKFVPDMIKRLDDAEDSKRADDDRRYLSLWFFETFGTYGIKYNFDTELSEIEYEYENQERYETAEG